MPDNQTLPSLIELDHAVFGTLTQALTPPISITLKAGDKVLLDGPSGTGKTSILRGLMGFLTLRDGVYKLRGEAVSAAAIMAFRQRTSYVNQELDVGRGPVHTWLREHLPEHALHESDFVPYALPGSVMQRSLEELSRGERQRLALLVAEARQPEVLLLDEITSALNAELRRQTVRRLSQSRATLLIVSHDEEWRHCSSIQRHQIEAP